jgi:hypothetical protein
MPILLIVNVNGVHAIELRSTDHRQKWWRAPSEVVEVPIPNDDFGDVFGGDDCVVLERRTATSRRRFLEASPSYFSLPSSSNGALPNPVFVTVTVNLRSSLHQRRRHQYSLHEHGRRGTAVSSINMTTNDRKCR